jgi:PAS domain S-box-containing protein
MTHGPSTFPQPGTLPADEAERIQRLESLPLPEGGRISELDQLVSLVAKVLGTNAGFVSLVGTEQVRLIGKLGSIPDVVPRRQSVCQYTILTDKVMAVSDMHSIPGVSSGDFEAYLAIPILAGVGQSALGVLGVMDRNQRRWNSEEIDILRSFASIVESNLERLGMTMAWQSAPLAMVLLDARGRCVMANPALARMTGRPVGALDGSPLFSLVHAADRPVLSAMLTYTLQNNDSPTRRELRYVRLSGEVVRGGTSMAPLHNGAQQAICIIRDISLERSRDATSGVVAHVRQELGEPIAALRHVLSQVPEPLPAMEEGLNQLEQLIEARMGDIYARFQAEAALTASEQRLRTVVENLAGLIVVLDDRGRIVDLNAVALRMLGWDYATLVGKSFHLVQPDFYDETCRQWLSSATERSETPEEVLPVQRVEWLQKGGGKLVLDLRSLVMDWNGPGRLVVIGHDVTEAQLRQDRLEQERDVLELRVQDRTDALVTQRKLEEVLKQSIAEKDTLLKEIHHRVKNNLQVVSSLLRVQVDHMPAGKAQAMLTESVLRVRSMAMIHEQLYSSPSLDRVDLGAYAGRLVETLRYTLAPDLRVTVCSSPIEVTVETAVPIGLILNELITNAFKYGCNGRSDRPEDVRVELETSQQQLYVRVRDWGPGLPEGLLLEKSPSLGLKLVRTLSRQVKGKLQMRSDEGAAFELVCPV